MKRLLIAIAAAATTMFASAAVLESEDFESSSWTGVTAAEYGKEETSAALQYPFTATNKKYGVLDDDASSPAAEGATCFDMYVQFTAMTDTPSLPTGAKIAVYADAGGNIYVLTKTGDYMTDGTVDADTWARLTIVAESNGYKVYVNGGSPISGTLEGSEDSVSVFPAETGATTVEFTGSGKLDNFVARTTDPFGDAPTGWIANIGTDDPEQYFTDYTKALEKALAGATLTFADPTVRMDGSAAHPFEIRTVADLKALQAAVAAGNGADKCYVQTAEIALTEAWPGIGVQNGKDICTTAEFDNGAFTGTYDGGNYTISNFQMVDGLDYCGFFNSVKGATIKNLKISYKDGSFAKDMAAANNACGATFVGVAKESTLQNLTSLAGTVSCTKGFGGIVGYLMAGSTVDSCTNNVNLTSTASNKAGGIAMITQSGTGTATIRNCQNNGTTTGNENQKGGIVGYVGVATAIDGCSDTAGSTPSILHNQGQTVTISGVITAPTNVVAYTTSNNNPIDGLDFAIVDANGIATFVKAADLAAGNTYKVMGPKAKATYAFTDSGSISFDTSLATPTYAITVANPNMFDVTSATEEDVTTYTAAGGTAVASITKDETTTQFNTVAKALAAAAAGDTITLVANSSENVTVNKAITFVEGENATFSGTFDGSGTIAMTAAPKAYVYTGAANGGTLFASTWAGTFQVAWNPGNVRFVLDDFGKANSTVEIVGENHAFGAFPFSAWVNGGAPTVVTKVAIADGTTWTVSNGNSSTAHTTTIPLLTGGGNLVVNGGTGSTDRNIYYTITSLSGYTGTLSGSRCNFKIGNVVYDGVPTFGDCLVKVGANFGPYELSATTVNNAAAQLAVGTVNEQTGIYVAAASAVIAGETVNYATIDSALAAADVACVDIVTVYDTASATTKENWSYENGVYTSTREVATLKGTSYTSLAKALAAAQDGDTVTLVAATSEAVTIPAGVTVAVTDDVAFSGKLSGAGAIKYTKVPQKFPASTLVAGEWIGTFIIAYNQETSANIAFNSYGISGSYVEIAEGCSLTGHCMGGTLATLVVNGTLNIVDGSTVTTATIYALAGSGNVSVTQNRKYTFSNLVDWNGKLTSNGNLISIGNITSGAGSIEYQTTPAVAPTVGEDFEGEVYLNFNYSNYDVYKYAGTNATVKLGTMTGHLHDGAGETGQTGEIPGKTVVAGNVTINNGYTISSANWTAAKVVKFDSLKVDDSLTLDSTSDKFGTARCYYYVRSLDAAGVGTITVGDGFGLRIDAVDFAEAPSGSDALVRLTLEKADQLTTDGQLFGTGGTLDGSIAVTVNGEATEQTLVYDADKDGLVLYVAPTPVEIDPSEVVINYNCKATLRVTGYPEGATFGWTMYTNGVACSSLSGPVQIASGKNTAEVTVYSVNSAFDGVVAKVAITNGEEVIEREATITVADVAAKIGETEYTKAQLDNAIADAISSGAVLEHYLGVSTTISKGQTLKTKKLAGRNGSASVKAAASTTAGEAWTIAKTEEDGVITWSVGTETAYFEFTSADSQTVEYLASPKNAAGVNKLLSDATITKQFSVTKDGVVLDLNGHALTSTYASTSAGAVYVNVISPAPAALTVKDSVGGGSIAAASAHSVFMLGNNGQLTVEGGSFTGKHIVYGSKTTSAATITGGTFTATDAGFTLNMLDSARGTITVTGGTFTGFNPANNSAEGAGTNFVPNGYVSTETSTGVWTVSKSAGGFPGGEDGKTFNIDTAVQAALEEKIPAGKALTDAVAGTTSGVTYAQAYALGLLDEETGAVEKDVTPTIEIVDGKVVVSLDATAKAGYKVMLNVYEKSSLTDEWPAKPTKSYELKSAEDAGFEPSNAGAGFYKVGVTIEDAE